MARVIVVTFIAAWFAAACGFHLRGDVAYSFQTIYVTAPTAQPIVTELKRFLDASSSTKLVDNAKDAAVTLEIVPLPFVNSAEGQSHHGVKAHEDYRYREDGAPFGKGILRENE